MKTWHCEEGRMVSGTDIPYDVSEDGDRVWYDGSEVDAERAKDREEIKKWKNAFYTLDEVSKNQAIEITELKYGEIARLRKAVQEIEYLADRITIENESIARAILKLAREALEGE
jgi:hypothetical protein